MFHILLKITKLLKNIDIFSFIFVLYNILNQLKNVQYRDI